ncbi:LrgB family protein [Entomospira entomophila]|uniref:LrgB family protein n=1 Tax=Entomospira entomophila TaxID=2719988 RepID=A0A968KTT5_9SPIO|nr:LrgB family protein [Entomospira entomophilus]NIZ40681.1 LrgB family protein [Entomospira entomophilus]WDI34894.1 LrgB family protein [Entomospira entomophilus]
MESKISAIFLDSMILVGLTVCSYMVIRNIQIRAKGLAVLNPTLWSGILIIGLIQFTNLDFKAYMMANKTITFFLAPMTIALGFSMYDGWSLIKHYLKPLTIITVITVLISLSLAQIGAKLLGLEGAIAYSVMPKSVTSPIGILIIDRIGGISELAVFGIIWAGVVGNLFGPFIFKIFKIKTALAQGYSLGAVAHVLGMSRANEMGKEQGAAASAAIGFTGILTIVVIEIFLQLHIISPLT